MNTEAVMHCKTFAIGLFLLMLFPGLVHAEAGHFLFVYGKVSVTASNGTARQAAKGMKVQEGETIASGLSGAAQLRMEDGAFLAVRPNTVLRLDTYAYKENGRKAQSTISLLKGTFRAITGKIGNNHPQNDLVKTPVATIGIRGTDHEPAYIPPPPSGQKATIPPGAYDKVNKGTTFMQTSAGRIDLGPNQVGHAASMDQAPVTLPAMPAFYQTPDKPAVQEKKDAGEGGKKDSGKKSDAKKGSDQGGKDKGSSDKADNDKGGKDQGGSDQGAGVDSGATDIGGVSASETSATDSNTTNTTPQVVQTVDATSDTGTSLDLTAQTSADSSGKVSDIDNSSGTPTTTPTPTPTITTAALMPKKSAGVSYINNQQSFISSYSFLIDGSFGDTFTTNTAGSLTAWAFQNYLGALSSTIKTGTVNGISGTPQPTQANSFATTGIKFGSYGATSVSLALVDGSTTTNTLSPQYFNWITGPGVTTSYLSQDYLGTASFAFDGGVFRTETGATPSALSSNITVDFSNLSLGLSLSATVPTGSWVASASNVPLDGNSFSVWDTSQPAVLSVTYTPTSGSGLAGFGNISGSFTGSLTGIITSVDLGFSANMSLTGLGAFVNSTNPTGVSSAINHQIIGFASLDPRTNFNNTDFTPTLTSGFYNIPGVDVTTNAAGGITSFLASLPLYFGTGTASSTTYVPTQLTTTGTVSNTGSDSVSGISWGRWSQPIVAASLATNTTTNFNPPNLHYIAGPASTQQVQLPVSGTFSYTLAGGTNPTDNLASAPGTLNSASLTADFTNMKVDVSINATVAATTLAATVTGMPIQSDTGFDSSTGTSLSITCSGTCNTGSGSVNTGNIGGIFTGSTGNGAGVAYSLKNAAGTTSTGTVISGVAAFHR